jgi:hypothetical protein
VNALRMDEVGRSTEDQHNSLDPELVSEAKNLPGSVEVMAIKATYKCVRMKQSGIDELSYQGAKETKVMARQSFLDFFNRWGVHERDDAASPLHTEDHADTHTNGFQLSQLPRSQILSGPI